MRIEGLDASCSPSFDPLTDRPFTHPQRYRDILLLPTRLFQLPRSFPSFFSPIGFLWCSHTSYLTTLYFPLPRSVELGRKLLQCRINQSGEKAAGKPVGECGHKQHVVDYRTKQILTMMGKGEFKREYYDCNRGEEQQGERDEKSRKCNSSHKMKVAVILKSERGRERSELTPDVLIDTPKQNSMRYVARRTAKGDFDQLLYGLARQSGLEQARQIVVLGDGAPWIWKLACEHFPEAVQIVDLSHAQEHVWQVVRAVYGPQTEA